MENIEDNKDDVKENVRGRILKIMEREGLNAGAFAESIKVAQATISQILRGRNMPSTEMFIRLHQRYPDINLDWLITGEGNMSNSIEDSQYIPQTDNHPSDKGSPQGGVLIFDENATFPPIDQSLANKRKEIASEHGISKLDEPIKQEVIYRETPPKKITEIRIFFEDNTFQVFKPE